MIAGEAAVFIILLVVGVYFIRRSILKELALVKEKKNFSLSVTHELKTPIASTKLFVETLINRDLSKEKEKEILKKVYSDQNRLQKLVEDILLASKIEDSSTLNITLNKVNLLNFVKNIVVNMENNNNNIKFNIDPSLFINIDTFYFQSVIQNLQSNAVKYSKERTSIIWNGYKKSNKLILQIKDEGKGIDDNEKLNVFKLFYRSGNEDTRSTKGTGIGLYLVSKIVKLHKGKIKIIDNIPKGTIIEIELQD